MEETIKGIEVIAYKGMKSDMTCRDFKYELGKTYKTDKVKFCNCGFHACLDPKNVFCYYSRKTKSRYFKVKLSGEITKCPSYDTQVAATEITILEEITDTFDEVIKTTEWWKNDNVIDLLYFLDGFARVQRKDNKWNFIDTKGKILYEQWFMWAYYFNDGFARVQRTNDKWNFIDKDGNYLYNEWFNYLGDFRDGFAIVQRGDRLWNFIDKKGKLLSEQWFNDVYCFHEGFARVQKANGEWCNIDKIGTLIKFKDMEEKIKQVEDIDTLKELNKNLISENERLTKKNVKLSEKYQSTHKKNASLKTAIASIKGFENAEQLCAELNRLKQQNKSLSEANAKLIADAKVYLKTIDEQKKVISASEKSIGAINDKLKIITLSQQSMHQALKDSGEEKSELVKKYKEALSAKSVAEARQEELEKENIHLKKVNLQIKEENIQIKKVNIQLRENIINVYYKASLLQRIKYVFTKSI